MKRPVVAAFFIAAASVMLNSLCVALCSRLLAPPLERRSSIDTAQKEKPIPFVAGLERHKKRPLARSGLFILEKD